MPHDGKTLGINRRTFIKQTGLAGAAFGLSVSGPGFLSKARAADKDRIIVGHPSSLTGPLAGLGEPTEWVTKRAVEAINKDGGIFIKELDKKLPVEIKIVDTQSDPTKSSDVASKLILRDKIDLMLVMFTPDVVNPVTNVCERYEVPCISLGSPAEPWLSGGPYHWSYMAFWSSNSWTDVYIDLWDKIADRTNKVVGGLFPNDPDGNSMAPMFKEKLEAKGYKFIDPGRFPYFTPDYSSIINAFKKNNVDILTASLISPDWTTAWRQCHQAGFKPKMASVGKALLFPSALEALGNEIGHGLTCEIWWSKHHPFKSSLTGEMPKDICEAWEAETGKQWAPPIGFKHAGYELVYDVLTRAGTLDKESLRQAIDATDKDTIIGHIKFDDQHVCETPLVNGQWVKGQKWPYELQIVNNTRHPEIPITAELVFPLPG
jgi:branched-chain amino acid transport system substrate-binding protein